MFRAKQEPSASDELNDRTEEEESAVEGEPHGFPVRPQQPVQHFEPLQINRWICSFSLSFLLGLVFSSGFFLFFFFLWVFCGEGKVEEK